MLKSVTAMIALSSVLTSATGGPAMAGGITGCSVATLKGQYPFATTGTLFPPAFGVTSVSQSNAAGYNIFNGDGTGTSIVTFRVNGVTLPVTSPTPITYTLGSDCTGTLTVEPSGPHFNIYAAFNGESVAMVATDTGFAASDGPDRRVQGYR